MIRKTHEEFIYDLNKFNYDKNYKILGIYNGNKIPILIENKYGKCLVHPQNLMKGFSPTILTAIDKTSYWINMAKEIHGEIYNYNNAIYEGVQYKVQIECKDHGIFEQKANDHIAGHGCKKCAFLANGGYNLQSFIKKSQGRDVILYIIHCWSIDYDEEFWKIGITSKSTKERFSSCLSMPYNYEVFHEILGDAESIYKLEQKLHKLHKEFKYRPHIDFPGKTECYDYFFPLSKLYDYLEKEYRDDFSNVKLTEEEYFLQKYGNYY